MSFQAIIKSLDQRLDHVHSTAPAFYTAAAHVLATVTGGPVWVKAVVEYLDTAMTNVTTTTLTYSAIAMDAGAVAINAGAIGSVVPSPMVNAAKTASALATQIPNAAALTAVTGGFGMVWGLGALTVTFATVMDAADRYSIHIVYQKLSPASLMT